MLLLDTCALIWLCDGTLDASPVRPEIEAAATDGRLRVSVASAWEIGLLSRAGRVRFLPDAKTWFQVATDFPGFDVVPITAEIAIDSSQLPGELHGDPADRLIIATARHLAARIVTRDRRIVDYAGLGHVSVLVC